MFNFNRCQSCGNRLVSAFWCRECEESFCSFDCLLQHRAVRSQSCQGLSDVGTSSRPAPISRNGGACRRSLEGAAELLGVSSKAFREWDRARKPKTGRHPLNRYRLYLREDLKAFLRKLAKARAEVART